MVGLIGVDLKDFLHQFIIGFDNTFAFIQSLWLGVLSMLFNFVKSIKFDILVIALDFSYWTSLLLLMAVGIHYSWLLEYSIHGWLT